LIKNHEKKKQIYQQTNKIFHKPIHEESVDQKILKENLMLLLKINESLF